jgi:hypothetical protein
MTRVRPSCKAPNQHFRGAPAGLESAAYRLGGRAQSRWSRVLRRPDDHVAVGSGRARPRDRRQGPADQGLRCRPSAVSRTAPGIGGHSYKTHRARASEAASGSSERRANAADAHPGRRQIGGDVSGTDVGSAGGPGWGPLERAIAGEVAVPGSPAFARLPRPFNARYHDPLPRAVVLCAAAGACADPRVRPPARRQNR